MEEGIPRGLEGDESHPWEQSPLTRGSIVPRSLILLPLRFRCVRFGHFSANTSRPPEILLSLSSSCKGPKNILKNPIPATFPPVEKGKKEGFTFLSLFNFGKFATEVKPTLIVLRNSSSSNSSVRPSIFPSYDLQLSRTSSFTCKGRKSRKKYEESQRISKNHGVFSKETQES